MTTPETGAERRGAMTEDEVARYLILNGKGWHDEDGPTVVDGIDAEVGLGYPVRYHWVSGGAGANSVAGFIGENYLPVEEVIRLVASLLSQRDTQADARIEALERERDRLTGELIEALGHVECLCAAIETMSAEGTPEEVELERSRARTFLASPPTGAALPDPVAPTCGQECSKESCRDSCVLAAGHEEYHTCRPAAPTLLETVPTTALENVEGARRAIEECRNRDGHGVGPCPFCSWHAAALPETEKGEPKP